jgi:hypothetical protein
MLNKLRTLFLICGALVSLTSVIHAQQSPVYSTINVTQIFTRNDVEAYVPGPLLDPKIDSANFSIIKYYQMDHPALAAMSFTARTIDTLEYYGLVDMAKKAAEYKNDIQGLGDKAFWSENVSYGTLTVVKGRLLLVLTVSQANPNWTKLAAATELVKIAMTRMRL